MTLVTRNMGIPLLALLAAIAAVLLAPPLSGSASANPCQRYGDTQPQNLSGKHARNAIVCLINKQRDEHGRGNLDRDQRLHEAARDHSATMVGKGCFSHECSGEKSLLERLRAVDYIVSGLSRWAYGENIGWGESSRGTPRETVKAWMGSSGHRANILSGTFRDVGAGFARKGDSGYYTADFGLRVG